MWNRIRKKVQLKSRSYELQHDAPQHNLEEVDLDSPESPRKDNRRSNGFTKCLIPNLSSNPMSCACRRNDSPSDLPVAEKSKAKDGKHSPIEKYGTDKSNSLTIGESLNYYFKETDSCELVRKNKSASVSIQTKAQKQSKVTTEQDNKKTDNVTGLNSMKEKNPALPLFPAGQKDIKSGLHIGELHSAFDSSRNTIGDSCKTVTFETFGKPANQDVKPPMFLPLKKKHAADDLLDPAFCELEGSLISSKGASLTSEEGAESGYGTQEDGPDRLARSISSSSESNAHDFSSESSNVKCQISRESTGEEDVFHQNPLPFNDKFNNSQTHNKTPPAIPARHIKAPNASPPNRNLNIVVAEVHAENSDEPFHCVSKNTCNTAAKKLCSERNTNIMDNARNDNTSNDLLSKGPMDINWNPKDERISVTRLKKITDKPMGQSSIKCEKVMSSDDGQSSHVGTDSDSDEEDIREYLPADINSMSEVFNSSLTIGSEGSHRLTDLYASVPKQPETEQVNEIIKAPPVQTITLPKRTAHSKDVPLPKLRDKPPSRPDLIDCHDRTPTPPLPPPPDDLLTSVSSGGSDPDHDAEDFSIDDENVLVSDDGDSGPPLPSRNYSDTLTKTTKEEKKLCEAPTLVMRQKSKESSPTSEIEAASTRKESPKTVAPEDEIVQQEEPIHMTWEEVMKEAKSLGIPLSPPTRTMERRLSTSSQGSSCTPISSPVTKHTAKVKRSQSECKKRSPFKDKLQSFFTMRKSKVDAAKTLSVETKERYNNRKSIPVSYERGCGTTQREIKHRDHSSHRDHSHSVKRDREYTSHVQKPCACSSKNDTQVTSPTHYNTYHASRNAHYNSTYHGQNYGTQNPRHRMNVSINVSVISTSVGNSGNSPEISLMTQSMDASIGGSPTMCFSNPMSQSMIEGSCCGNQSMIESGYPSGSHLLEGSCPVLDSGRCPGSPMSRSLICQTPHSMSNHSLSQQSVMSGQSAPGYYRSQSACSQLETNYHGSHSTCSQSAHSYQSAHSIGSPTAVLRRSTPNKGGSTSPLASSPVNGISHHYGTNGINGHYGTNGINGINGHYGTNTNGINGHYGTNTINGHHYGTNGTLTSTSNGCYGTNYSRNYEPGGEGGINSDFISSLLKLKDCGWYWGPLGWDDAESKLSNKPDGSFLVRDSSDDRYILSLSFRSQGTTHHTRIEHYKGMFSFYSQPKSHGAATIVEFIEKAMEHSRNGKFLYFLRPRAPGFPPAPVQLLYPVSRLQNMQSLQHMCRFVILKQVRKDHIDRLPIPPRLKEYLKQNQYYTEYLGGECTEFPRY